MQISTQTFTMASASAERRGTFIRKTYTHLAGAIAAFVSLEALILSHPVTRQLTANLLEMPHGFLMLLGAFIIVGMVASHFARSSRSLARQYVGLALYIAAEAVIFAPLLLIAQVMVDSNDLIIQAAMMTGLLFAGLTATVFLTGRDFSFLRGFVVMGGFIALGLIVFGLLFGFTLGLWFSVAMIALAAASILYETSNILRHYAEDQYVAAALSLFASVALLFWYVLRLLMATRR